MVLLRTGMTPDQSRGVAARPLLIAVIALALGGCRGHTEAYNTQPQWNVAAPRAETAAVKVEIEDDGLPSQLPPPVSARKAQDDPTEPWSRNYGSVPAGESLSREEQLQGGEEASAATGEAYRNISVAPTIPGDLPPKFRRQLAAAIAND